MNIIRTGVKQNNKVSYLDDVSDINVIDISYISVLDDHVASCENEECIETDHDPWKEEVYGDSPDTIVGFKESSNKDECWFWYEYLGYGYTLDENAEYSAIINGDPHYTTQVVKSKYVSLCNKCSPCYPNQGDLDTPGSLVAYALPPDCYDSEFDDPLPIIPINIKVKIYYEEKTEEPEEEGLLWEFFEAHWKEDITDEDIKQAVESLQKVGIFKLDMINQTYLIETSE